MRTRCIAFACVCNGDIATYLCYTEHYWTISSNLGAFVVVVGVNLGGAIFIRSLKFIENIVNKCVMGMETITQKWKYL